MTRAYSWSSCVVLAVMLVVTPARADDASESRTRRELGQEFYRQGRYGEALDMFLEAYRLVATPSLAFDLAQTYALLERPVQAYNWYTTFLRVSEGDPQLAEARARTIDAMTPLRRSVALIDLTTDPPGAEVFVDRVELGSWGVTPILLAVPAGSHVITFRLAAHHDSTATVQATRGSTSPAASSLAPVLGHLVVTTEPSGASIDVERTAQVLGTTPLTIDLPVGEIRLRAHLSGWIDSERTVIVAEGHDATLTLTLAREASTVAVLSVEGSPAGAHVLVDGTDVGVLPLTIDTLPVGTHEVRIESESLEPVTREVVLEAGGATRIAVTLRPIPNWEWPTWRWAAYGSGALGLVAAAAIGGLALSEHDAFFTSPSRSALDAQRTTAGASDVLFATGAVILLVTFILDLTLQPPAHSQAEISLDR